MTATARDVTDCDEYRALLRGVLLDPAADLPRLVLADWLDETGDSASAGRAELIRVQCELAKLNPRPRCCAKCLRIVARFQHRDRGKACSRPGCDLLRREHYLYKTHWFGTDPRFTFSRGFVAEVRMPASDLFGGRCAVCRGRGLLSINNRTISNCARCHGTGRVAGCAAELFGRHPVAKVRLCDMLSSRTEHRLGTKRVTLRGAEWSVEFAVAEDAYPAAVANEPGHDLVAFCLADLGRLQADLPQIGRSVMTGWSTTAVPTAVEFATPRR